MSAKEKRKSEDMAKADKVCYEREMKAYIPPKRETKRYKDPNAPKRPPSALFCFEYCPKIKGEHPSRSIGDAAKKLGEMWNNTAADDRQPDEKKAAKLEEKYGKETSTHGAKRTPGAAKQEVVKAEKSKKKERGKMKVKRSKMKMLMSKLVVVQVFFLSIKHFTLRHTAHSI